MKEKERNELKDIRENYSPVIVYTKDGDISEEQRKLVNDMLKNHYMGYSSCSYCDRRIIMEEHPRIVLLYRSPEYRVICGDCCFTYL